MNPYNQKVVHKKDDIWVFTEEMCEKRLKAYNEQGNEVVDTSTDIIVSRDIPVPKLSDMIKYIFMYYIGKEIIRLRDDMKRKYTGCSFHEVDCIVWPDTVKKYFKEAKSKISSIQVMKTLEKTMEVLKIDINMSEPGLLALVLNVGMRERELKKGVKYYRKHAVREPFYELFNEICPNLCECSTRK